MKMKPLATFHAFIGLGALWGMILGLATGLIVTLVQLLPALLSTLPLVLLLTAIFYILSGTLLGALLGGLQGTLVALFTYFFQEHPNSKIDSQREIATQYRAAIVFMSALTMLSLPLLLTFQSNRSYSGSGVWQIDWLTGLVLSAMLAIASGFVGYKLTGWYMVKEYGEKKKGYPRPDEATQEGYSELHPPLSDNLDNQEHQQRHIHPDEDIRDHQHRAG
jgi:hypothetical protein